ncbi:hypothetical protein ACFFRR_005177 [Megaselia abdita]
MDYESRVQILWEAAGILSGTSQVGRLLKAHYLRSCMYLDRTLPTRNNQFCNQNICSKCGYPFVDGQFKAKVCSRYGALPNKVRNLISAFKQKSDQLTRKQKIKAKLYIKKNTSIVLCCSLCGNNTKINVRKPRNEDEIVKVFVKEIINLKNKNKKKPKNKNNKIDKRVPVSLNNKTETSNNKKPELKKLPQRSKKSQTISATKQSNNLLKLAEMLKQSNSSSCNQLNKFLK